MEKKNFPGKFPMEKKNFPLWKKKISFHGKKNFSDNVKIFKQKKICKDTL